MRGACLSRALFWRWRWHARVVARQRGSADSALHHHGFRRAVVAPVCNLLCNWFTIMLVRASPGGVLRGCLSEQRRAVAGAGACSCRPLYLITRTRGVTARPMGFLARVCCPVPPPLKFGDVFMAPSVARRGAAPLLSPRVQPAQRTAHRRCAHGSLATGGEASAAASRRSSSSRKLDAATSRKRCSGTPRGSRRADAVGSRARGGAQRWRILAQQRALKQGGAAAVTGDSVRGEAPEPRACC